MEISILKIKCTSGHFVIAETTVKLFSNYGKLKNVPSPGKLKLLL